MLLLLKVEPLAVVDGSDESLLCALHLFMTVLVSASGLLKAAMASDLLSATDKRG